MSSPKIGSSTDAVVEVIIDHLRRHAPSLTDGQLDVDTAILESGALDSLGILQLTMLLGDTFDIEIEDEDFVPENFGTVGDLTGFILRKQREKA